MRWPRACGASRRVRTSASGRTQPLHRLLRGGDLGAGHLREILVLQHLAVGHRHAGIELDLALFFQLVVEAGDTAPHGRAWRPPAAAAAPRRRLRQHHRHQLIDIAAAAKKDAERLVEQHRMLVPLDEHRMQRPVEILAGADAGGLHRFQRIEHRARPDRNAGRAQRAGEIHDVFGEAAVALCHSRSHRRRRESGTSLDSRCRGNDGVELFRRPQLRLHLVEQLLDLGAFELARCRPGI